MILACIFFYISGMFAHQLLIPKLLKTHRLTSDPFLKVISNALNYQKVSQDYFNFPSQVTSLTTGSKRPLCKRNSDQYYLCDMADKNVQIFKIQDVVREMRIEDSQGRCLTLGLQTGDNEWEVVSTACDPTNPRQVFILMDSDKYNYNLFAND